MGEFRLKSLFALVKCRYVRSPVSNGTLPSLFGRRFRFFSSGLELCPAAIRSKMAAGISLVQGQISPERPTACATSDQARNSWLGWKDPRKDGAREQV
jgi:hypothetical protein